MTQIHAFETATRDDDVAMPKERSFGIVFFVVCALVAGWGKWQNYEITLWVAGGLSLAFLGAALLYPRALHPLNKIWFRIGLLLHVVVSPILMFAIFTLAVLPTALVRRLFVKQIGLQRAPDSKLSSYWVEKSEAYSSMKQQF